GTYPISAAYSGGTGFNASNNASQSPAPTLTVGAKPVTVTPNSGQSKVFGASDPPLTYTLSESIPVTGALGRAVGENVGRYAITLGTLASTGSNYNLVLAAAPVNFTITAKPVTVTPNSGQSKIYGDPDPNLTYSLTQPV